MLLLHFKRWEVISYVPFQREKIYTKVGFETLLPVAPDVPLYHLRAVVVHHGGAGAGHYTSFVRAADNNWYHCDDCSSQAPRKTTLAEVLQAEAYMLVYECVSMPVALESSALQAPV